MSKPLAPSLPGLGRALSSVDEVLALVRARGGRATPPRRTLLEVLFEADAHLSAEELAAAVQARAPEVHMSTIYRNLEDLQRLGVVVHSHLGHGPATYQLASLAHGHFICEVCGVTIEAPDQLFQGLSRTVKSKLGFSIDPHHFAILGRCAACEGRAPRAGPAGPAPVRRARTA
ncbi:MAG TPA: transcriptional repressor [Acidimicrobiales bacterium]|nr:transcriptional repressor [Acidimicrobiales bacterium]